MKTTRIATSILALTLFAVVTAHAGDFDPILDADIIDNQMVGQNPTGRRLTADELVFDPVMDADIYDDPALYGGETTTRVLIMSELDFEWIFDDDPICPHLTGVGRFVDVAKR